jgi:hypothetical protein
MLVHSLIFVVLFRHAIQWAQAGGGEHGPRGGGGGSDAPARYVQLPALAAPAPATRAVVPAPATPVPEPVPAPVVPDVPVTPPLPAAPESSSASGTGVDAGGAGPGTGGGVGAGAGAGVGNDSGPGRGGDAAYITPPDPRTVLLPADCYKGHYAVRFWVEADGSVSRVVVDPPPKSGGCRREVQDKMMGYQFHPARARDGRAVAYVYQVQLTR